MHKCRAHLRFQMYKRTKTHLSLPFSPHTHTRTHARAHRHSIKSEELLKLPPLSLQDLNSSRYRGPAIAAKAVADFFPPSQRPDARILDVAAGSGFVGEEVTFSIPKDPLWGWE